MFADAQKRPSPSALFALKHPENGDQSLMDALVELHGARWQSRGERGMIEANRSAGFLRDIVRRFSARGMVRFFCLRSGCRVVAIILGFLFRGRVFGYLNGFDPGYRELSLGQLLLYHSLRHSYERSLREWCFLRGCEPYKFEFGAQPVPRCRLVIRRET